TKRGMASCWRSARFSRASWRGPPRTEGKSGSRWRRKVIIQPGLSPAGTEGSNHLGTARVLRKTADGWLDLLLLFPDEHKAAPWWTPDLARTQPLTNNLALFH